jgi:dephospho-CoA kinase
MSKEIDNYLDYARMHKDKFISDITKNKKISLDKTAVFMAGSPGSGKSEIASSISSMYPDYVIIDADYFRSKFPEVELNVVLKDFDNNIADVHFDADNVRLIVNDKYTQKELEDKIND